MVLMHLEPWVQLGLCVPVLLAGGKGFFRAAWRKGLGVDALVSIGIGSSFLHGLVLLALGEPVGHEHFHNTAMITTIMNWGNFLEESASASASKELSKRLEGRSTDEMVSRVQNGNVEQVFVDEVQEGDHVIVKSGERIPVDGIVESGSAWVDESILTGESVPVSKDVGSLVSAGTTITISSGEKGGAILIQAQAVGPATFESAISRQLEVLRATKSSMQRYADQVSAIFVPGVLSISASSLIGWSFLKGDVHTGLEAAVSVLVAACPCALGLATPSAIQVGIGQACKSGIIFQSAHSLENAGSLDAICFDKTVGTVFFSETEHGPGNPDRRCPCCRED
jgi:P-type E1-E2 ATPase